MFLDFRKSICSWGKSSPIIPTRLTSVKKLAEVDSPNGANGPEPFSGEAEVTGEYRFEVKDLDPASPPGKYEMRVAALLSPEDYARHKIVDLPENRYENYRGNFELSPGRVLMVAPIGPAYTANGKEGLLSKSKTTARITTGSTSRRDRRSALTRRSRSAGRGDAALQTLIPGAFRGGTLIAHDRASGKDTTLIADDRERNLLAATAVLGLFALLVGVIVLWNIASNGNGPPDTTFGNMHAF